MKYILSLLLIVASFTVNAQCPAPVHYGFSSSSYLCDNNACTQGAKLLSWSPNGQGYPSHYVVSYRVAGSNKKPKTIQVQSSNSATGATACWADGLKINTTYEWWVANVSCGFPGLSSPVKTFTTPANFNY